MWHGHTRWPPSSLFPWRSLITPNIVALSCRGIGLPNIWVISRLSELWGAQTYSHLPFPLSFGVVPPKFLWGWFQSDFCFFFSLQHSLFPWVFRQVLPLLLLFSSLNLTIHFHLFSSFRRELASIAFKSNHIHLKEIQSSVRYILNLAFLAFELLFSPYL